jgi:hypothetical protein
MNPYKMAEATASQGFFSITADARSIAHAIAVLHNLNQNLMVRREAAQGY